MLHPTPRRSPERPHRKLLPGPEPGPQSDPGATADRTCVISLEEDHRSPGGDRHPSFGSPAIRLCLTRGFASPSRDEFALIEKGSSLCGEDFAREVPSVARFESEPF
jgi:hypothetical protein